MNSALKNLLKKFSQTDWPFLFFIIGIVNVKIYIKIVSLVAYFIYMLFFSKTRLKEKIPIVSKFYFIMPLIGIIAPVITLAKIPDVYWFGYAVGLMQWMLCGFTFYIVYVNVKNGAVIKIRNAVDIFFIVNIVVSLLQLLYVMKASHSVMPYWTWDASERFGASTGDNLLGIVGGNSIANAAICVLGATYYLICGRLWPAILCLFIILLCTSNISLFVTILSLVFIVMFYRSRKNLRNVVICFIFILGFYPFLSPVNLQYIQLVSSKIIIKPSTKTNTAIASKSNIGGDADKDSRPGNTNLSSLKQSGSLYKLNVDEKNIENNIRKLKLLKSNNELHKAKNSNLTLNPDVVIPAFSDLYHVSMDCTQLAKTSKFGKIYSLMQTASFLTSDIKNLIWGAGIGNFSSKLSIKMTGLGLQGKYPEAYIYAGAPFLEYHFYTILFYLAHDISLHSALNFPNSVYNQIAGEYGLLGIIAFIFLYIGFFWKHRKKSLNAIPLLIIVLLYFNFDYWFEMISFTVIFELLILLDIFAASDNANQAASGNNINAHL